MKNEPTVRKNVTAAENTQKLAGVQSINKRNGLFEEFQSGFRALIQQTKNFVSILVLPDRLKIGVYKYCEMFWSRKIKQHKLQNTRVLIQQVENLC